ncbi:MAG: tRNA-binding protein [Halanaerobium sp.]|nr:tRNA-binding protein [Halanaerobium sp.]
MTINWEDFTKVVMRVGTVLQVNEFPEAQQAAYRLMIDFGEHGIKKSSAQITDLYSPEELIGKQVIAVTNFPPKQIANFMSDCLVLGLPVPGEGVILIHPDREAPEGTRLA